MKKLIICAIVFFVLWAILDTIIMKPGNAPNCAFVCVLFAAIIGLFKREDKIFFSAGICMILGAITCKNSGGITGMIIGAAIVCAIGGGIIGAVSYDNKNNKNHKSKHRGGKN